MSNHKFKAKVEQSEVFKSFEKFKQVLVLRPKNMEYLEELTRQAERYGLPYLKQNPNINSRDFNLVKSLVDNNF